MQIRLILMHRQEWQHKKIGGKDYLVRSFFTGEKKLDEVITRLAIQRVYDELERSTIITNGKENRFGLGGKK